MLSKATGQPVRVQWSREEELGWEFLQIYGLTETSPLLTVNRQGTASARGASRFPWLSSDGRFVEKKMTLRGKGKSFDERVRHAVVRVTRRCEALAGPVVDHYKAHNSGK